MKITKEYFDEWLEHPVTLEMKEFLKEWKKNIEEGILHYSLSSNISSEKSKSEFIFFLTSQRIQYSILNNFLNLKFEDLQASKKEILNARR